jgi:hypothetical protein
MQAGLLPFVVRDASSLPIVIASSDDFRRFLEITSLVNSEVRSTTNQQGAPSQ